MAEKLVFRPDDGIQEISINDKVSVWINLTDMNFIARVFMIFDAMDKHQEKYQSMLKTTENLQDIFKTAREMDAEMRTLINTLFDTDVCTPIFGDMNVYALAGGTPVWFNLIMCLIENMDDTVVAEKKKTNPKLQKYLARFNKKK